MQKNAILAFVLCLASVLFTADPSFARNNNGDFESWVAKFKQEAMNQGIGQQLLDDAFDGVEPNDGIIELDRKQPETTIDFQTYVKRVVPEKRIARAQAMAEENKKLLEEIGHNYGVLPEYIVALWAIESNFGDNQGDYSIVESLATLAYDGRRSEYFRKELMNAFLMVQKGDATLDDLTGSWAGAMGMCQFMPSSFLKYAVDYDGDGKKDIWHTNADAFASIANYLSQEGWEEHEPWGREVRVPEKFNKKLITLNTTHTNSTWQEFGIRKIDGSVLPSREVRLSLITVDKDKEGPPFYLVSDNYKTLLKWNRSRYFATSVGLLADKIQGVFE